MNRVLPAAFELRLEVAQAWEFLEVLFEMMVRPLVVPLVLLQRQYLLPFEMMVRQLVVPLLLLLLLLQWWYLLPFEMMVRPLVVPLILLPQWYLLLLVLPQTEVGPVVFP